MKLFKTTSRHTSYRTHPRRVGHVHTVKAKTRLKHWLRRKRKDLWRKAKMRIRRRWRQHQRNRRRVARNQPVARTARQFQQHHAKIHAQVQADTHPNQARADGAIASCRRCHNEVQYNAGRQRWEHTGKGHAECFQPHRSIA